MFGVGANTLKNLWLLLSIGIGWWRSSGGAFQVVVGASHGISGPVQGGCVGQRNTLAVALPYWHAPSATNVEFGGPVRQCQLWSCCCVGSVCWNSNVLSAKRGGQYAAVLFALELERCLSNLVSRGSGDSHQWTKAGHQALRTLHAPTSWRSQESVEGVCARIPGCTRTHSAPRRASREPVAHIVILFSRRQYWVGLVLHGLGPSMPCLGSRSPPQ